MAAIFVTTVSAMVVLPSGVTSALCRVRVDGLVEATVVEACSVMVTSLLTRGCWHRVGRLGAGFVTYLRCDLGHPTRDAVPAAAPHAARDERSGGPGRGARPAVGAGRPPG